MLFTSRILSPLNTPATSAAPPGSTAEMCWRGAYSSPLIDFRLPPSLTFNREYTIFLWIYVHLSSLSPHLTPDIEPEACLCFVDGDHMGLQDALPRVLLPPVVVVVLRVHHPAHSASVVGGAADARSENSSAHRVYSHFFIATTQSLLHFSFCCHEDKPEIVGFNKIQGHHEQLITI